jgi:sterol desaturase/sphingolipid hydroxylase (fatty acid hydroxylase superfamily)
MKELIQKAFTEHTDPSSFALPCYFILMGIELYFSANQNLEVYEKKDTRANFLLAWGFITMALFSKVYFYFLFTFIYQYRLIEIPEIWWAWIILIFADDFTYYWYHRLHHKVRIFWASHIVHHSTQKLNFSTPFRLSWIMPLYYTAFWLWLPFVGFQPWMVLTAISISFIYQYWTHTTLIGKLGFVEWFMNTPSHHRVHHASNIQYLDKNHGAVFIIWDRLFGTFQEEQEKPVYGLTNNIHTYKPVSIAFYEYNSLWKDVRKAKSFTEIMKYLFYPPGWSADGSGKTAKQLQNEMLSRLH